MACMVQLLWEIYTYLKNWRFCIFYNCFMASSLTHFPLFASVCCMCLHACAMFVCLCVCCGQFLHFMYVYMYVCTCVYVCASCRENMLNQIQVHSNEHPLNRCKRTFLRVNNYKHNISGLIYKYWGNSFRKITSKPISANNQGLSSNDKNSKWLQPLQSEEENQQIPLNSKILKKKSDILIIFW